MRVPPPPNPLTDPWLAEFGHIRPAHITPAAWRWAERAARGCETWRAPNPRADFARVQLSLAELFMESHR
jgi:hypothetical protein